MKKPILLLILIMLIIPIFNCCSSSVVVDNKNYSAYRLQDNMEYFVDAPIGEYYMNPLDERGMIYFSEHGKHEFYLLCNKPDCSHNDVNCNAYAGLALGYYNEHLYTVYLDDNSNHFALAQMNMDGSAHKKICSLPEQHSPDGATSGGGNFCFHNGYLFYELMADIDAKLPTSYYRISLETGNIERIFQQETKESMKLYDEMHFFENKIYFCSDTPKNNKIILYQGDLKTLTSEKLIDDFSNCYITNIDGNKVYYYHFGVGFCEYDLTSKTETIKLKPDYYVAQVTFTDEYIFAKTNKSEDFEDDWYFCVYDRNYQLLNKIKLGNDMKAPDFMYINDGVIYFSQIGNKLTHYIKIKNVEKDLSLIQMTDPYAAR